MHNATMRVAMLALVMCVARAAPAQTIDRFTAESVVSIDFFGGDNVSSRPQTIVDATAAVRIDDHWTAYVRPWFRKARPATSTAVVPAWDAQLYAAAVRYERHGATSLRFEAGQIASPVGLGSVDVRRDVNPVILPHLSYVVAMPAFDPAVPRQVPISDQYPLGAVTTVSADHWDVRGAVVNSAPTHAWAIGADNNPRQTPIVEAGGGVTPKVGLRFGGSFARGQYATEDEVAGHADGRAMTLLGGEAEYAFGYTKLSGEVTRTAFEAIGGSALAYQYFVQGVQTISPRWFAAARFEGASAPPLASGTVPGRRTNLRFFEATGGFRLTPAWTARTSFFTRHNFTATTWDRQVGFSLVWAQRWR